MSVFTYDLGKESIGYCVRNGYIVQEMGIDLVDANHASITERGLSSRRRAIRTRLAHKMRETWFRWFWSEKLGLTDLPTGDERWSQEFSHDGCFYNGASIRVAILQGLTNPNGTPLEGWQLFKGFWSLIQRRGYDEKVAWGEKDKKEDQALVEDYKKKLEASDLAEMYHLPAYLETFRLGIWHPVSPKTLEFSLGASPLKVRNDKSSAPREMVVAELKALVEALKVLRPQNRAVQELTFETLAYGNAQMAYATYFAGRKNTPFQIKPFQKLRGSFRPYKTRINGEWFPLEWEGVLSQKTPRFDNRILSDCCLIPRFHVCRNTKKDGSWKGVVVHQAKALMMLRNLRFMDMTQKQTRGLTPKELNLVWDTFLQEKSESLSSAWLNKMLPKLIEGAFYFKDNKAAKNHYKQFDDWKSKDSGRSRFSRPGSTLLRDCLLSGLSPQVYVEDLLSKGLYPTHDGEFKDIQPDTPEGRQKGLTPQDLQDFAKRLGGESWDNIHIADNRNQFDEWNQAKRERYIEQVLIGKCMNNVVRNRLQLFYSLFKKQVACFGIPDYVVLEFVRGDMSITQSKKKKDDYNAFLKSNTEKNNRLRDKLKDAGICSPQGQVAGKDVLRLQLLEEQGGICLYTGRTLNIEDVRSGRADIEHSVPMSRCGSSNRVNLTFADAHINKEKDNKTPYEFMMSKGQEAFNDFASRVLTCDSLPKKKKDLLLSPNAEALVESYNGLADTAHISRLIQQVVAMYCGKGLQVKDQERFVYVMNGRETADIGRHLDLYKYLLDDPESIGELEPEDRVKKFRANRKHHALDAYIISWYREYTRRKSWVKDESTTEVQKWCFDPAEINEAKVRQIGRDALEQVIPRYIKRNKAELDLEETYYGIRHVPEQKAYFAVKRVHFQDHLLKQADAKKREKALNDLMDKHITEALMPFVNESKPEWEARIKAFKHPRFKNTPNKVMKRISTIKEVDFKTYENGRIHGGEYYNIAKSVEANAPLKNVQLKRPKANIGQILYYDEKGKVKVQVVYPYIGLKKTMKQLELKGYKLYKNGMVFNSGCLIHIPNPVQKGNETYQGIYSLTSILASGQIFVKKVGHKEDGFLSSASQLTEAQFEVVET